MFRIQLVSFLAFAVSIVSVHAQTIDSVTSQINRMRALGTAYMEEDNFENAIRVYREAVALIPDSVSDTINLGIACYHGDHNEESIRILQQAREKEPKNPFANYTLGLAYKKIGDTTNALTYFQLTCEADSTDAATLYNLGLAHFNLKNNDESAQWFEKTIAIDPKHSPSYYNLFLYYARVKKDAARSKELMTTFQELKKTEPDRPADAVDEGKFLGPIEFVIPRDDLPNYTSELKPRFALHSGLTAMIDKSLDTTPSSHTRFLAVLPNPKTRNTAILVSNASQTMLLTVDWKNNLLGQSDLGRGWHSCAPADFDNDGDIDLFLFDSTESALLRNEGEGKYIDITGQAGLSKDGFADALWSDFDAEGDLDLFLAHPDRGDRLFQNNGNGTFTDISEKVEGLPPGKSFSIAATDLDNDNDLDIVRAGGSETEAQAFMDYKLHLEIFTNQREVRFQKAAEKTIPFQYSNWNYQPFKIRSRDIDNDGRMDIVLEGLTFREHPSYILQWNTQGELITLPGFELGSIPPAIMGIADLNNDGYEDFLVSCTPPPGAVQFELEGALPQVILNQFPRDFLIDRDAISFDDPKKAYYYSPLAADFDFDGDLDLFLSTLNGLKVLENQTGQQNRSIALKIEGAKNPADGYGAKIHVKDDRFFVKKEVDSTVTHIGIGERERTDVIRITWPNGIFQNLIQTSAGTIKAVTEKPGYAGSCLFVYTWNGEGYEFIADSLCNAPLGLYVGGGYYPPNPDEYIRIPARQIREKNGEYEILMREELREITYLDQMELLSARHPDAVEIHSNECFTMPPFPEFQLIGLSPNARPPRRVTDNHGNDVTEQIVKNDYRYPIPWQGESRMDGVVKEHTFEIDLGDVGDAKTIYLFMTGYLDWPNSSNARSLEQNPDTAFIMPLLQVRNERGEWQTVRNPMGFPAGKLKTVPVDLSNIFLTNDRTIRIVSTVQVHWDRMLVDTAPILDGFTVQHYPYRKAELRYGGYARTYSLSEHGPQWYDYTTRYTNSRWDYQRGNFTRYGDITPLLTHFDDMYAIIQHGDEVCVRFDARRDSNPNGEENAGNLTFFLKSVGWVKDLDYSTAYGQTVEPLPFKDMSAYPYGTNEDYPWNEERVAWWMEYNTRVFMDVEAPIQAPRLIAAPRDTDVSLLGSE